MKKIIFFFAFALALMGASQAQTAGPILLKTKKTVTAADTITHAIVGSKVKSLCATYVETSGTSAGKFYIEGTVDNVAWINIDSSKSVSDVTTIQTIKVDVTSTTFSGFRCRFSNTSGATGTFYFTALRRPDE